MFVRFLSGLLAFGLGFLLVAAARAEALTVAAVEPNVPAIDAPFASDDDVARVAADAYVWGWPLVYVHNTREIVRKVPAVGKSGGMPVAPLNELCMLTDYINPATTTIACPNQDVVYGFGMFDLAAEPVVVQVPDFGDRFWLYQLGDARTDGFAKLGKVYGTKPGLYLVVGPNWQGTAPAGIVEVLRSPTDVAYCVPRVFMDDTAADRAAVKPVVNQIMAYPLRRSLGKLKTCDWTRIRWLPKTSNLRAKRVDPETFFDDLAEVLASVPPLAGEEARYADYRKLLAAAKADPALRAKLVKAAVEAEDKIMAPLFEFRNFGTRLADNWTTIENGAEFGTDYLTRAAVAKSNVFVNRNNETKYYYQDLDAAGLRLDGRKSYRVTFAAGKLPPAAGFWSLTLYNAEHGFHKNETNRFSLGTKNKHLRYNADGSLTLIIQSRAPSTDEQANWLPAPEGPFSLYLRAYAPESIAIEGCWTPPAVVATTNAPHVGDVASAR